MAHQGDHGGIAVPRSSQRPRSKHAWQPLIDRGRYDLSPTLTDAERDALQRLVYPWRNRMLRRRRVPTRDRSSLERLLTPVEDVLSVAQLGQRTKRTVIPCALLLMVRDRETPYWTWSTEEWRSAIDNVSRQHHPALRCVAYLIGDRRDIHARLPSHQRDAARAVFGREAVDAAYQRVEETLVGWGFQGFQVKTVACALSELMLRCGTPRLEEFTAEDVIGYYQSGRPERTLLATRQLARYLVAAGMLEANPLAPVLDVHMGPQPHAGPPPGVSAGWAGWCRRWLDTSTLAPNTRRQYYGGLLKVGRWLAQQHPGVTSPEEWNRELAAEWVAAVDRMRIGEYTDGFPTVARDRSRGRPLSARAKAAHLVVIRTFFRDCQGWGWIPVRFDASRALAVPRSVKVITGPTPRVIADDIWAKLLWAGLNLTADDVGRRGLTRAVWYPPELVRAVTLVWLFTGLRTNEIARLPVGCVRWQDDVGSADAAPSQRSSRVCLLDVPVNKTSSSFTKPVDPMVGEAIAAWEAVRPLQPVQIDPKTGAAVEYLFSMRGRRISGSFVNNRIIPMLCGKANVPREDGRGPITSHRARSTIATQLYNAANPMTLFELMAWLGHRSPSSTQHYAMITPVTLTKAYKEAGYLTRNLRVIDVLVDRDAIASGAAAAGAPWQHYDLGHGYCTYDFFARCPHRMACARCDFYIPKASTNGQLLESRANMQRLLVEIPLMEDERAAVENDSGALDRLLDRLADVPTPSGRTPREMRAGGNGEAGSQ